MKRQKSIIVEIFVLKIMDLKTFFLILEQIFLNFFFKSNIERQPAPYTAKCIDDWSETEYNIQPKVNYSIAVSKLDIIALLSCTMLIVEHSIKVSV
jgi:hypothetical protein